MQKKRFEVRLEDITIVVDRKIMKTIRLSVNSKDASVHLSAPIMMTEREIEDFLLSKADWIKSNVKELKVKIDSIKKNCYETGDIICFLGKAYLLEVIATEHAAKIEIEGDKIKLSCRGRYTADMRAILMREWYRKQLYLLLPDMICKWEKVLGVKARACKVNRAQTRWGSCNVRTHDVHFSINLANKPLRCIEYVVAHELTHLLERGHNKKFYNILDGHFEDAAELKLLLKQKESC